MNQLNIQCFIEFFDLWIFFVCWLDLLFMMIGVSEGNVDELFLVECNGIEDKGKEMLDSRDKEG